MPHEKQSGSPIAAIRNLRFSRSTWARAVILLGLSFSLAALFPVGAPIEFDYDVGGVWAQKDLIAPFSFPIYRDEREYSRDVEEAKKRVYTVFERDPRVEEKQQQRIRALFNRLEEILTLQRTVRHGSGSSRDSLRLVTLISGLEIPFSDRDWFILGGLQERGRLLHLREHLIWISRKCWSVGVLDRQKSSVQGIQIAVRKGTEEEVVRTAALYDTEEAVSVLENDLRSAYGIQDDLFGVAYRIGVMGLAPNVLFSGPATEAETAAAVETVPRTFGYVQENERIVSKHERITEDTRLKLESFKRVRADRSGVEKIRAQYLGVFLHVLVILALFGIYLALFRKKIYGNYRRLILISLLILLQGFLAYLTRELDLEWPVEYLIIVPVASMLLTIIFDSRVAFYGTVIIAFVVGGIRGNDYSIALASLVGGSLSVYTVRDIRNRTQIFRSMGFIFLGYGLTILALALERFESLPVVLSQLSLVFVNALISPVLTYGLLIFFERSFKVTTDLSLIELSHFNHPLLRQLEEKAPGTYHHSMTIASLAEAAASAIGANEILARVGASFHDIGKIIKPTYFVENQRGSRSRHDKLAPRMSSLIIQAHVKEGISLARDHRLPEEVIDFIPMHHGTTRIEYFYNKALRLAENSDDQTKVDEIKDQDYRYPGPKPQTKETGILMLADATEASVRSLEDYSLQKLEATIDEVIKRRFEEGELDECPLTLKDLSKIKEAFLRVLMGIHHTRVKYPGSAEPLKNRAAEPIAEPGHDGGGPTSG